MSSVSYNESTSYTLALVDYYDEGAVEGPGGSEGGFPSTLEPASLLQKIMSFQTYNISLTIIQVRND